MCIDKKMSYFRDETAAVFVAYYEIPYIDCEETKGRNPQNPNFSGSPKN